MIHDFQKSGRFGFSGSSEECLENLPFPLDGLNCRTVHHRSVAADQFGKREFVARVAVPVQELRVRHRAFAVIRPFGFLILLLLIATPVLGNIFRPIQGIVLRLIFGA